MRYKGEGVGGGVQAQSAPPFFYRRDGSRILLQARKGGDNAVDRTRTKKKSYHDFRCLFLDARTFLIGVGNTHSLCS